MTNYQPVLDYGTCALELKHSKRVMPVTIHKAVDNLVIAFEVAAHRICDEETEIKYFDDISNAFDTVCQLLTQDEFYSLEIFDDLDAQAVCVYKVLYGGEPREEQEDLPQRPKSDSMTFKPG